MARAIQKATDYHDFTSEDTPEIERRRLNVGDYWENSVQCKLCGDIIRSKNKHDLVSCSCKTIAIDGGSWILRRIGQLDKYIELSTNYKDVSN